jgi:hypothetical protein
MYPYKIYCSKPGEDRRILYPVLVTGYALSISASAFNSRILTAGYKASKKHKSLEVYKCLPHFKYDHQIQDDLEIHEEMKKKYPDMPFYHKLQEKEYELLDFYKEIGYDKATGKINGRTLAQHIKHFLKEKAA